jgi:hypothetical protein
MYEPISLSVHILKLGHTRNTFATAFPPLFEKHYGRPFDKTNDYDLMLAEAAFSEAFGWLGDGGKAYRSLTGGCPTGGNPAKRSSRGISNFFVKIISTRRDDQFNEPAEPRR